MRGEFGGEFVLGALHQARVIGTGDVEFDGAADAEFLGLGDGGIDPGHGAREHDLAGGVEVGDVHIRGGGERLDLFFLAADQRGHRAFGGIAGFFHEGTAFADDSQAVFEREGAGGGVGGEFTEREPGGGDRGEVRQAFADQGERHQAVKVEGGLAARGFREFLVRAFEHDLRNGKPEGFVGLARPSRGRWRSVPRSPCPCPLSGRLVRKKEERFGSCRGLSRGRRPV